MITHEILESLPADIRQAVKFSLVQIYRSGLLELQLNANFAGVQHGSADESAKDLADRIIHWRIHQAPLTDMIELGKKLSEELEP